MKVRPMLGELEIHGLEAIESSERRALVEHEVPGLEGSYFQDLGSAPNRIVIEGSKHGDDARDEFLEGIRELFNAGEPTTFIADILTGTDLTQVVIEDLDVEEVGGAVDALRYRITLRKYVEPPEPVAPGLLDAGILEEALGLTDAFDLLDQFGSIPGLGDPTPPVKDALGQVEGATTGLDGAVSDLESLFDPVAAGGPGTSPTDGPRPESTSATLPALPAPDDVVLDPDDPRIDTVANQVLQGMLASPDAQSAGQAAGLAQAIGEGGLAGITGDDSEVARGVAAAHGIASDALVPDGEDAAVVLDANAPLTAPPSIIVRRAARGNPSRLASALESAGRTFQLFRGGLLGPCANTPAAVRVENLVPVTFCRVPQPVAGPTVDHSGQPQGPCPPIVDFEDVHFNHDRHVLMPEGPSPEPDGTEAAVGLRGLDVVAAALAHSRRHPARSLLVTGHTDRTGSIRYNLRLSARRADNVFFVIQGHIHKPEWVKSAMIDGGATDDWRRILRWVHKRFGMGAPASDPRSPDAAVDFPAIRKFQQDYNAEVDRLSALPSNQFAPGFATKIPASQIGFVGMSTWQAFFDFYQRELMSQLGLDTGAELQAVQGRVPVLTPPTQGCGEFHSEDVDERRRRREAGYAEEPGPQEPVNRRVELLFFDPGEAPDFPCHPTTDVFNCDPAQCLLYRDGEIAHRRLTRTDTPITAAIVGVDRLRKGTVTPDTRSFSPRLGERMRFRIRLGNLPTPFEGKVRLLLARPLDEGLGTVAAVETPVCTHDRQNLDVAVEWDGTADRAVPRQVSRRTTPDRNRNGTPTRLPLREIDPEEPVPHGVYSIERLEVTAPDGVALVSTAPADPGVSVHAACTLFFNLALFVESMGNFGIGDGILTANVPYLEVLRRAVTLVMERYYEGVGLRFATTADRGRSVGIEVEFTSILGQFGEQFPGGHVAIERGEGFDIKHNIFGWCEASFGNLIDVANAQRFRAAVGPTSILARNLNQESDDAKAIHELFGPLGVPRGSAFAPPTMPSRPAPRTVADGRVTGRVTPLDETGTDTILRNDGIIEVRTKNTAVVPTRRADDIRKALNAFANAVGTIGAHELGHCLGLLQTADPTKARIEIPEKGTFLSPLVADDTHNRSPRGDCLMDEGGAIRLRTLFEAGRRLAIRTENRTYLDDCYPDRPGGVAPTGLPKTAGVEGGFPPCVFSSRRTFPKPSALPFLREVARRAAADSTIEVLVLGHSDARGSDAVNAELSRARARAVAALLTGDERYLRERFSKPDPLTVWEWEEAQFMLSALPFGDDLFYAGVIDGDPGPLTTDAVVRFQTFHDLEVTAELDGPTLDRLVHEYTELIGASRPGAAQVTAHGGGSWHPQRTLGQGSEPLPADQLPDEQHPGPRRVDVFFARRALEPPISDCSATKHVACEAYEAWCRQTIAPISITRNFLMPIRLVDANRARIGNQGVELFEHTDEGDEKIAVLTTTSAGLVFLQAPPGFYSLRTTIKGKNFAVPFRAHADEVGGMTIHLPLEVIPDDRVGE